MKSINEVVKLLGTPYSIKVIDGEEVIYRDLSPIYEFEVSHVWGKRCSLYVWVKHPQEIVGIYRNIPIESLKDVLGYYAVKYQNLAEQILIEREDQRV